MRTNKRVAAIIINGDKIFLINRQKRDQNYYILPGGGVEEGETVEEAVVREIKEELSIDIIADDKFVKFENTGNIETYFLVKKYSGEINCIGDANLNDYITDEGMWIELVRVGEINLLPEKIKEVLKDFKN